MWRPLPPLRQVRARVGGLAQQLRMRVATFAGVSPLPLAGAATASSGEQWQHQARIRNGTDQPTPGSEGNTKGTGTGAWLFLAAATVAAAGVSAATLGLPILHAEEAATNKPVAAAFPSSTQPPPVPPGGGGDYSHVHLSDLARFQLNPANGEVEWHSNSTRPRIVILGTGWGSVSLLKGLDVNNYEIVVISPRNYFLYTPLLPSACTGALGLDSLVEPIRRILFRRHGSAAHDAHYVEAKALELDRETRKVKCIDASGRPFHIQYDHLVVGVGANSNTFNVPGVKEHALFLKEAHHARLIRAKVLSHFELASSPTRSLKEKEQLLQFVVVGGGPTGVEFAGELIDLFDSDLCKQFPTLMPLVRVRLLEGTDHILNMYDAAISAYAENKFKELRIEVLTNALVQSIGENSITYKDLQTKEMRTIPVGMCIWSTGIAATDFTKTLASQVVGQSSNSLMTDGCLRMLTEIPVLDRLPPRGPLVQQQQQQQLHAPTASSAPSDAEPASAPGQRNLRVDPRVYAIGDCATTYLPKLSKRMEQLFKAADHDNDGVLSDEEFRALCAALSAQFPPLSAAVDRLQARVEEGRIRGQGLTADELQGLLVDVDRHARAYPATAQVASQQGKYLAKRFNAFAREQHAAAGYRQQQEEPATLPVAAQESVLVQQAAAAGDVVSPPAAARSIPLFLPDARAAHPPVVLSGRGERAFHYRHLASLAYIGRDTAAIDLGPNGTLTGWGAFWLWKSAYFSKAVSMRTRVDLAYDWGRTYFFGRDTTKPL